MQKSLLFTANKDDFLFESQTDGGPGGQSRNRSQTAVRVTHKATGLSAYCASEKSQLHNKRTAFKALCVKLVERFTPKLERQVLAKEVVRTYNEPDNRVVDKAGIRSTYRETVGVGDIGELIDARAKVLTDAQPT